MIYLHIVSEYYEYLFPKPIMKFDSGYIKIPSGIGEKEIKISCKSIKTMEILTDKDDLQALLSKIVNKQL